jgi:hypothetical protein
MRDLVVLSSIFIATLVAVGELASPLPVTLLQQIVAGLARRPQDVLHRVLHIFPKKRFSFPHNVLIATQIFQCIMRERPDSEGRGRRVWRVSIPLRRAQQELGGGRKLKEGMD